MNCLRKIVFLLLINLLFIQPIAAEDKADTYTIIDYDDSDLNILLSSENYSEANNFYYQNVGNYQNLCMLKNDDVVLMEYGTIYIRDEEDVSYYSTTKEKERILEKANEYDLLFIQSNNNQVKFVIDGDIGLIDEDKIIYYPYNSHTISYYESKNGELTHHIASSVNNYYKYNIAIDRAPVYFDESKKYYSYDGHYFYDDFYTMSDDLSMSIHEHSINNTSPYYNYYLYLPARSYSNYSLDDFKMLLYENIGINGRLTAYTDFDKDGANDVINLSEYYENIDAFVSGEKIFGVNALLSLAWSSQESAFGKSFNSYANRNVFNHSAYSEKELNNNRYANVRSSIFSHMENYVSKKYCDVFSSDYVGSNIGDYQSGISSIYSCDPYFGEKVASKAFFYDSNLGFKDSDQYTIGICNSNITLYYDKELSTSFAWFKDLQDYSLILLDEYDDSYKIQCDYAMNQTGRYNPLKSIAYVKKNSITKINEDKYTDIQYKEYIVEDTELPGENIILYSKNEYDVENDFVYREPDGCEVCGYHLEDNKYIPSIKNISEISLSGFKYPSMNNHGYVIGDGTITIKYEDGTEKTKKVTIDDIVKVKNANSISHIDVSYKGIQSSIELKRDYQFIDIPEINQLIVDSNNRYSSFSFDDIDRLDLDFDIHKRSDISTYIRDNDYNFSISGVFPSIIYYSNDYISNVVNTFYFDVEKINKNDKLDSLLQNYHMEYIDAVNVSIKRNFFEINLISPVIMQLSIPHSNENYVYSVYYIDDNNNIIKCPTQFSDNNIRFMTLNDGDFFIYGINTASNYSSKDIDLRITYLDNGVDYYSAIVEGIELLIIVAFGYVSFVLYFAIRRKERRTWKDFKKSLQQVESVQEEVQNN